MALELNTVGIYFAENYASLQLAVDAMPARGGTLILSAKDYVLTTKLVINKPMTIQGQGAGDRALGNMITKITTASATIDMIEFAAPNITLRDVGLENTHSLPTAGSGIKVTSGIVSTGTTEYPAGFRIENVGILGFHDNINIVNSYLWSIDNLISYKAVRYGLLIENQQLPDGGDSNISNSWFFAMGRNSQAGIRQLSSGGLKITNTKFNSSPGNSHRMNYGYDGLISGSSILCISNCSFENFNLAGARISSFNYISVNSCEFAPYGGTSPYCIDYYNINTGTIIGNTFVLGGSENGIKVTNSSNITLLNAFRNTGTGANVVQSGNTNFLNVNP